MPVFTGTRLCPSFSAFSLASHFIIPRYKVDLWISFSVPHLKWRDKEETTWEQAILGQLLPGKLMLSSQARLGDITLPQVGHIASMTSLRLEISGLGPECVAGFNHSWHPPELRGLFVFSGRQSLLQFLLSHDSICCRLKGGESGQVPAPEQVTSPLCCHACMVHSVPKFCSFDSFPKAHMSETLTALRIEPRLSALLGQMAGSAHLPQPPWL